MAYTLPGQPNCCRRTSVPVHEAGQQSAVHLMFGASAVYALSATTSIARQSGWGGNAAPKCTISKHLVFGIVAHSVCQR